MDRSLNRPLGEFCVLGHRGARGYAPDNTLISFRKAIELNATMTELDVRFTKDKEIVIMHDGILDHSTSGSGKVSEHTLKEIKKLDAGRWFGTDFAGQKVPTLQEVMALVQGKIDLNIEVKAEDGKYLYPGMVDALIEHIRQNDMVESVVVSSFFPGYLLELREKAPEISVALLYWKATGQEVVEARENGWDLHSYSAATSSELVEEAHRHGIIVRAWNPNKAEEMRPLLEMGVDGIGTDYPDVLIKVAGEVLGCSELEERRASFRSKERSETA